MLYNEPQERISCNEPHAGNPPPGRVVCILSLNPGTIVRGIVNVADSDYVNGEVTGTTKANQDSDEEMVDTGHCTSPRQANGSDGVHDTGKGSLSGKQEDTGSANPSKVGSPFQQRGWNASDWVFLL
jgi:hypothetical protein